MTERHFMTQEDCDKRHGFWSRILQQIVIPATFLIAGAAFGFAFKSNREVGEVKTQANSTDKRVDKLEDSINHGFQEVLSRLPQK